MATRSVSRAAKAQSRPTKPGPARARKIPHDMADRIRIELAGAKAATMTAILALEGKGVDDEVALSLRRHVLLPLEAVLREARS